MGRAGREIEPIATRCELASNGVRIALPPNETCTRRCFTRVECGSARVRRRNEQWPGESFTLSRATVPKRDVKRTAIVPPLQPSATPTPEPSTSRPRVTKSGCERVARLVVATSSSPGGNGPVCATASGPNVVPARLEATTRKWYVVCEASELMRKSTDCGRTPAASVRPNVSSPYAVEVPYWKR